MHTRKTFNSHTCAHKKKAPNFHFPHSPGQVGERMHFWNKWMRHSPVRGVNSHWILKQRRKHLFKREKNHFHFKTSIMKIGMNFRRRTKHQKPWLRFFRKLLFFHNPDDPVRRRQPLCFWILTLAWRLPFNGLCWEKWAHCQVYLFGWIPLQKSPILLQRIEKLWEIWDDLKLEILKPRQTEFVIWSCKNMTLALVLPPLHLTNATKVNISQM